MVCGGMGSVDVGSRLGHADVAEDFVGVGLRGVGEVPGGDFLVSLSSDEDDVVVDGGVGDIGEVEHGHVHADGAEGADASSADDGLALPGEDARESAGVADGGDGDEGVTGEDDGAAVGDGGAGGESLEGDDGGLEGEGGSQGVGGMLDAVGPEAVESDAGSREGEGGLVVLEDGGGGVGVDLGAARREEREEREVRQGLLLPSSCGDR